MKKILYPTDFSSTANNAFVYALDLAEKLDAEIIAVHVYHLPDIKRMRKLPSTLSEVYEDIEFEEFENFRDALPILKQIAEENHQTHVKVKHLLVKGEAVPTISRIAKKEKVDFVIMGTKGATGLKELILGSTTAGVITKVRKIIISVPEVAEFDGALDQIVFLTDYKKQDIKALVDLLEFSRPFPNCHIHCLHFDLNKNDVEGKKMQEFKSRANIKSDRIFYKSISCDDLSKGLDSYCEDHQIDIVAILPKKRNLWQKLIGSSFTIKMAQHLNVPLMTLSYYSE